MYQVILCNGANLSELRMNELVLCKTLSWYMYGPSFRLYNVLF